MSKITLKSQLKSQLPYRILLYRVVSYGVVLCVCVCVSVSVCVCLCVSVCVCLCVAPKLYEKSEYANATDTNMTENPGSVYCVRI